MGELLLEVDELMVEFKTRDGQARAVNGVSFTVEAGQTVAILGESGSGKSVTAQAIMGILDTPPARITGGSIKLEGVELIGMPEPEYQKVRGNKIAMIFQDALSSLNPVMTVGDQIAEMYRVHSGMSKAEAKAATVEVLERVRIPAAEDRFSSYPHEFSGGMRQRIMIAMMIALKPLVLIADEPTTALDVTVQAQIMDLLNELKDETNMGLILITHDLGVVADVAQRISVMYAGRTMERGSVDEIYTNTANPYTYALLQSIPKIDMRMTRLPAIKGLPPSLFGVPPGCAFNPRCPMVQEICRHGEPPEVMFVAPDHGSRCWFAKEVYEHGIA
ncbi:MAG: ABC transporter ATP-binding protein [Candidatus Nanopelagicales bacterium]